MKVRKAQPGDTEALQAIVAESGLFAPHEFDFMADMISGHFDAPEDGHVWLIVDQVCSGAAFLTPDGISQDVMNILFLAVRPAERRSGVARALVTASEETAQARSARILLVETSGSDAQAPARALYRSLGYVCDGEIRDYYAPGDDKVIFRKHLSAQPAPPH